jgi:ABC-type transport system substrate-binding protein
VFRRYPTEDALVAALLAGEVDVTSALGPGRVDELRGRGDVTLDSFTGLNVAFLSVNNEHGPWTDVRVRQAASRAVDREALVSRFLRGHGEPAQSPLPTSLLPRPTMIRDLVLDIPGARRLLAEAGFSEGFDTTLLAVDAARPYMPTPLALAGALRDQLAVVGIRAALRTVPSWSEYLERATRGDYDLAVLGWQADSTDPNDFLSALVSAEAIGTTNRSRHRSPAMDALLKRARRESDPAGREAVYREAQGLFQKEMPFIPLYHVSVFTAYRRAVGGVTPGPTGLLRYDKAWKVE